MASALTIIIKDGIQEFLEITRRGKDALDKHEELVQKTNGVSKCKIKEDESYAPKTRDKPKSNRG